MGIRYRPNLDRGTTALVLSLGLLTASAQKPEEQLTLFRRTYQDQSSVVLKRNTTYHIERSGAALLATRSFEEETLTLKGPAGEVRAEEVHYSGLVPLLHLEAYTLTMENGKHRKVRVDRFDHRDDRAGTVFHDDNRVAEFFFPAVVPGAVTHLQYDVSYPDARFCTGHYFSSGEPVEESTITVVHDREVEVDLRTFHVPEANMVRTRKEERGKVVQRITVRKLPSTRFQEDAPSFPHFMPHAQLVISDRKGPGDPVDRLYEWCYPFISTAYTTHDPSVAELTASVVGDAADDRTKAARIYRWMQDHVQYIAFEDGYNGWIPAPAADVARVRYGDCKGMSNLLRAMLVEAGLKAHLVWIGTRTIPYSVDELPTNASSDHMIVELELPGDTLFLDATSDALPFGMPSGFIQGKDALIAVDSSRSKVLRVPIVAADANRVRDSVDVSAQGNDLIGSGQATFTGYERIRVVNVLKRRPRQEWNEMLRYFLMKGSNKFVVDSFTVTGMEDRDAPLLVRYAFRIPGHLRTVGEEAFLPLTMIDPWRELTVKDDRTLPFDIDHRSVRELTVRFTPPAGMHAVSLPPEAAAKGRNYAYAITHSAQADGTIVQRASFTMDTLTIDDPRTDWGPFQRTYAKDRDRKILLSTRRP